MQPAGSLEIRSGLRIAGFTLFGRFGLTVSAPDTVPASVLARIGGSQIQRRIDLQSTDNSPDKLKQFFVIQRLFQIGIWLGYGIFNLELEHLQIVGK